MTLFKRGNFTSHSGLELNWKIDCDDLTDDDLDTLAWLVSNQIQFKEVVGVPQGGLRFAKALKRYQRDDASCYFLIVDDVITTGKSFWQWRDRLDRNDDPHVAGIAIFSRGHTNLYPHWVDWIFELNGPWGLD